MTIESISHNAARLWKIMNDGTAWCYERLRNVSQLSDRDINSVLGWLAREDTIEITHDPASREEMFRIRHLWEGCF